MRQIILLLGLVVLLSILACRSTDSVNDKSRAHSQAHSQSPMSLPPIVMEDEAVLDEVVVSSIDKAQRSKTAAKRATGHYKKEALPSKNIASIAATSASVSVDTKGDISIRSGRPDASHYYIDGVRVNAAEAAKIVSGSTASHIQMEIADVNRPATTNEGYEKPEENKFISPVVESHSTFSLDVDKASYSNVRRFINGGQLPPPAAVRVEELVNYFEYDYAQPKGEHPITVHSSNVTCPWNKDHQLLHLSVKAQEVDTEDLPASNLVFLLDVSGSMSGRLPLVKESFKLLLDELRPKDKVAIVTYAGADRIALPSTAAIHKQAILKSLDNLRSGGGTAGARGIRTAYKLATDNFIKDGNNRVILATDGDFNIGVSSPEKLEQLITKQRESGVFLSVLGFGIGNYQDHKMQTLANRGNGNHAYIDNIKEAEKVFVNEFGGTLFTVAKDVKIQIEFNPAYVQSYRLIGYENRMLAKEDFNDDKKDAGEVGAGHTVTAIYEVIPVGSSSEFAAVVSEKEWAENRNAKQASKNSQLGYVKCRYKQPDADKSVKFDIPMDVTVKDLEKMDKDIQFSVAVAEFGMNVGQSSYLKSSDLSNCIKLAKNNLGADTHGYRKEFLTLAKSVRAQGLLATK